MAPFLRKSASPTSIADSKLMRDVVLRKLSERDGRGRSSRLTASLLLVDG